jgi:hypothetical protein
VSPSSGSGIQELIDRLRALRALAVVQCYWCLRSVNCAGALDRDEAGWLLCSECAEMQARNRRKKQGLSGSRISN